MELPEAFVDFVLTPAYNSICTADSLLHGSGPGIHIARLAQSILLCSKEPTDPQGQFLDTLGKVVQLAPFRNWFSRMNDLITGNAAGDKIPDRINVGNFYYTNYICIASKLSCLVADTCGSLMTLNELQIVPLANIANTISTIPFFGVVGTYVIQDIRDAFGIAGLALQALDGARYINDNGFTFYPAFKIVGTICKIVFIVLTATSLQQYMVLAQIANATSSALYLARFLMKNP
jgi:hypothetical protein